MVCLYGYILCVLYAHMYSVLVHEYIFRQSTTLHSSVCAVRADLRSPSLSCPTLFQGRLLHDGEQLIDLLPVRLGDVQDELVPWSDFLEGDRCWNLHTNRLGDALADLRERARDFDHRDFHVCMVFFCRAAHPPELQDVQHVHVRLLDVEVDRRVRSDSQMNMTNLLPFLRMAGYGVNTKSSFGTNTTTTFTTGFFWM